MGITLAKPGQRLDVAEGEGDFLALWHLHALAGAKDAAPVGLLGSCASLDRFGPQIAPYVAGSTVQIFMHLDAGGTGQDAAKKWAGSFYRLGAWIVRVRALSEWLGEGGNDLNDALRGDTARRRALTPGGLCPECFARDVVAPATGPTCACISYAWPIFTNEQIALDSETV